MYLVTNVTKQIISISDLGVVINKRQMIDLDKVKTLIPPEKSKDLQSCVRNGAIKVKHDRNTVKPTPTQPSVNQDEMLADLKETMQEEIRKQFKQLKITEGAGDSNSSDMQKMLEMMQQMMQNQQSNTGNKSSTIDEDDGVDDGVMSDIHAKAIDRLDKTTEVEINNEKSKIKGKELLDNSDELEGFI